VAVIGAGPAGLEAARRVANLGHQVTVYEAGGQLGGQLKLWSRLPFAREYGLSIDWYEQELARAQVPVNLNTRPDPDNLDAIAADAVILATGAGVRITVVTGDPAVAEQVDGTVCPGRGGGRQPRTAHSADRHRRGRRRCPADWAISFVPHSCVRMI
jgi:NADPH-dependent 2,4-dienoyl-CoA reductase/sulfur reductase-like enzyme